MESHDSDILTTAAVGVRLSVTPNRVRDLADAGKLRHTRTATGIRLFRREDVERLATERAARRGAR